MKKIVCYLLIAASAMIAASCQKEQLQESSECAGAIHFSASLGAYQTKAGETCFDIGDEISLWADAPYVCNLKLVAKSISTLDSEEPLMWQKNMLPFKTSRFAAIYPYSSSYPADLFNDRWNIAFGVQSDQSTPEKMSASDMMFAEASAQPGNDVFLFFSHLMSKIRITVQNNSGKDINDVFISEVYGKTMVDAPSDFSVRGDRGTIKACSNVIETRSFSHGTAFRAEAIIVPQESSPVIRITSAGNSEASFTIPVPQKFASGYIYDISLVLNQDCTFSDFSMEVKNWQPENEWEFSSKDRWKFLGKGQLVDNIIGGRIIEQIPIIDVDVYEDIYTPGRYSIYDPFTQDCYNHLTNTHDGRIVFNATDPENVYIERSMTGIVSTWFGETRDKRDIWVYSEGNGSKLQNGNISVPAVICYPNDDRGFIGWGSDFLATLVLPGYERVGKCSGIVPNSLVTQYDPAKDCYHLEFNVCPDNDVIKIGRFEGFTPTKDALNSIMDGSCEKIYTINPTEETRYSIDVSCDRCGLFKFVVVGICDGKTGPYYTGTRNLAHVPQGQNAPDFNVEIVRIESSANETASIAAYFTAPYFMNCRYLAVPASEYEGLSEGDIDDLLHSFDAQIVSASEIQGAYEGKESRLLFSSLEGNTKYKLLMLFQDVFGQLQTVCSDAQTGDMPDDKWVSIGTGIFYDKSQFFSSSNNYFVNTPYFKNGYFSNVEILKAENKEKYRIMHPYKEYWDDAPLEIISNDEYRYNGKDCEYIEFYVRQTGNVKCIYYEPFGVGLDYIDPTYYGSLTYTHPTGETGYLPTYIYNGEISPGVFNFAPLVFVEPAGVYFDYSNSLLTIYLEMPTK